MKLSRQREPAPVQTDVNLPEALFPCFSMCALLFQLGECFTAVGVDTILGLTDSHRKIYWGGW